MSLISKHNGIVRRGDVGWVWPCACFGHLAFICASMTVRDHQEDRTWLRACRKCLQKVYRRAWRHASRHRSIGTTSAREPLPTFEATLGSFFSHKCSLITNDACWSPKMLLINLFQETYHDIRTHFWGWAKMFSRGIKYFAKIKCYLCMELILLRALFLSRLRELDNNGWYYYWAVVPIV